jgi:hypothetical protein
MALRFLLDENQRGLLWRALQRHNAKGHYVLDVLRVGDSPDLPLGTQDAVILQWAENESRILVSFDKDTLATHLANHMQRGRHSPGIFLIRRRSTVAEVVSFLALAAYASEPHEWQDRIHFIG